MKINKRKVVQIEQAPLTPHYWLNKYNIKNYSIQEKGIDTLNPVYVVNVNGNLYSELDNNNDIEYLPINFGKVNGIFSVFLCTNLKGLEGAPYECTEFYCRSCNSLESIKFAPEICEKINCKYCNSLKELNYKSDYCKEFYCDYCLNLESIENLELTNCENFSCEGCDKIKYLKGIPISAKYTNFRNTKFGDLYSSIGHDEFMLLVSKIDSREMQDELLKFMYIKHNIDFKLIEPLLFNISSKEEIEKEYIGKINSHNYGF